MNDLTKLMTAIAIGAVTGILIGTLFAPDKGTETRKKIGKKRQQFSEDILEKLKKGKEKFTHLKENFIHTPKEKAEVFL